MITSRTLLRVLCNQNHPLLPTENHYLSTALRGGILDLSRDHDPPELRSEVTITKGHDDKVTGTFCEVGNGGASARHNSGQLARTRVACVMSHKCLKPSEM